MDRAKPKILWLAIGAAMLIGPAVSVFQMLAPHLGPAGALVAAAAIDVTAIYCGYQAISVGEDGDGTLAWNTGMIAFMAISIAIQVVHAVQERDPAMGLILGGVAVAGVVIIESQLRQAHRRNGRREGRVPLARPRPVTPELALKFPRVAQLADKLAVKYAHIQASDVLAMAWTSYELEQAEKRAPRAARVSLGLQVPLPAGIRPAIEATRPDDLPESPETPELRSVESSGSVSALVRQMWAEHGPDDDLVVRAVRKRRPDAKEESVRRTIRTIRKAS